MHDYSAGAIREAASREFQVHRHFLWGLCYRMTASAADADDLVQETFVRAIERPPLDMPDGWRAWLARVATSLSIDALRRRKRCEYIGPWLPAPVETGDEVSPAAPRVAASGATSGYRYDLLESVSVAFLLALEPLTPRERAVLILHDVFDHTVQETAQALDLTQANVKATHHRAREAMKGYEQAGVRPTRDRQATTAERLREFLDGLWNQKVAGVEAMLAKDARALSDSGGEFVAARRPIVGRRNVARLLLGLAAKRPEAERLGFRMLNGLPALVVDAPAPQGFAPRFIVQVEVGRDGSIDAVHTVMSRRKLVAVRFER
jgi:RNA polymerase sigma-70 factor (ECF subfamily)